NFAPDRLSKRRERIVALLERLVEAIRQPAVGADVAFADEPLAVELHELRVFAALLVETRRLADAFVRNAGPDHVGLRTVALHLYDGVRQQHAVVRSRRGVRIARASAAIELLDFRAPVRDRAVDV